jgi:hypothetical protein
MTASYFIFNVNVMIGCYRMKQGRRPQPARPSEASELFGILNLANLLSVAIQNIRIVVNIHCLL